jgi:hypothetical protein
VILVSDAPKSITILVGLPAENEQSIPVGA